MSRIIILTLIALFALVNGQIGNNTSNVTTESTTVNLNITTTTVTSSTTSKPTTDTTDNSTTTPVPTTPSSTLSPTSTSTTPTPTIPPIPKPNEWNGTVTKDKYTCINVQFSVQIRIKYNNTNNTELTTGFNIPVNAMVDENRSSCNDTELQVIVIRFDNEEHTSANLTLKFNKTNDNVMVEEIELSYILTEQLFPFYHDSKQYNEIVDMGKSGLSLFSVAKVHSYVCDAVQMAKLDDKKSITNGAEIDFTNSKVQAYIDNSKSGKFDSEINCKTTEISDVVPIAVGAALAGLVVIVLIAYFVGRRRSRRLAYQSV